MVDEVADVTRTFEQRVARAERAGLSCVGDGVRPTRVENDLVVVGQLAGAYDKLVSIEMIEAVGAEYLDTYLSVCARLLKDDGSALIQAISINGQIYERALKEVDFIKKYIFPGSFIPSLHAISESLTRQTDFRIYNVEDMTPHYERTLQEWQKNFNENFKDISRFGFDERFRRMWNYYFSYCIGGFAGRSIGSLQILLGKPGYREDLSVRTTIQEGGS